MHVDLTDAFRGFNLCWQKLNIELRAQSKLFWSEEDYNLKLC